MSEEDKAKRRKPYGHGASIVEARNKRFLCWCSDAGLSAETANAIIHLKARKVAMEFLSRFPSLTAAEYLGMDKGARVSYAKRNKA